jgi:serine/threonine protein kinase
MAPEIINNQTYRGSKADIWALGVSTYCMIFNKLPFDSQDNLEHLILNQEIDLTG